MCRFYWALCGKFQHELELIFQSHVSKKRKKKRKNNQIYHVPFQSDRVVGIGVGIGIVFGETIHLMEKILFFFFLYFVFNLMYHTLPDTLIKSVLENFHFNFIQISI